MTTKEMNKVKRAIADKVEDVLSSAGIIQDLDIHVSGKLEEEFPTITYKITEPVFIDFNSKDGDDL